MPQTNNHSWILNFAMLHWSVNIIYVLAHYISPSEIKSIYVLYKHYRRFLYL